MISKTTVPNFPIIFLPRYLIAGVTTDQCENQPSFIPICVVYVPSRNLAYIKHCYIPIKWNQDNPVQVDETILIACGFSYDPLLTSLRGIHVVPFTDEYECRQLQNHTSFTQKIFVRKSYFVSSSGVPAGVIPSGSELIPTCILSEEERYPFHYFKEFCLIAQRDWVIHMHLQSWHITYAASGIGCTQEDYSNTGEVLASVGFQYISESGCESVQMMTVCMMISMSANSSMLLCTHPYMSSVSSSWDEQFLLENCIDQHGINQVSVCQFLHIYPSQIS